MDNPDHFQRLGIPRRFSVSLQELEANYLQRSRLSHPDYHALADSDAQRHSLEQTAALNEAYLTLKEPFRRSEYLLKLLGGPSAQEVKNLDQSFLMEMMEYREQLEEYKAGQNHDGLQQLTTTMKARESALFEELNRHFETVDWQQPEPKTPPELLTTIRQRLNALKTIRSLLRDIEFDE